jgi:peptidyl-prolyl cis-trans isomerase D
MAKQPTPTNLTKKHLARIERERIRQRYILTVAGIVGLLIFGFILYGILDQYVFTQMRPVARVGTENISTADFQKQVRFNRYRLIDQLQSLTADPMMLQFFGSYVQQIQAQLSSPAIIGQDVLNTMIEDAIIRKEAERLGITLSEAEVNQELEQAFGFYADGTPTPTITPTPFATSTLSAEQLALIPPTETPVPVEEATPAAEEVTPTPEETAAPETEVTAAPEATPTITLTPTPYTRDLYEDNLNEYVDSAKIVQFNKQDLRDFIYRQALKRKVYEAVTQDINTTAEQVWARHILVPTEEMAQVVLERLQNGESFVDIAREMSLDTGTIDQGGDLGWFTRDMMIEPFSEAAFNLNIGEFSQPVQTQSGYHIIQVLGREERPLNTSQLEQARSAAYQEWLENAKKEYNVETYDRWMDVVPNDPRLPPELARSIPQ